MCGRQKPTTARALGDVLDVKVSRDGNTLEVSPQAGLNVGANLSSENKPTTLLYAGAEFNYASASCGPNGPVLNYARA